MDERDVCRMKEGIKKLPAPILIAAAVAVFVLFFARPWVTVGAGQRGVVMNFGAVQPMVLDEGLHFRVPIM